MNTQQLILKAKQYPFAIGAGLLSLIIILLIYYRSDSVPELEQRYDYLKRQNTILDSNKINSQGLEADLQKLNTILININERMLNPSDRARNYHYFFSLEQATKVKLKDPRQELVEPFVTPASKKKKNKKDNKEQAFVSNYYIEASGTFPELLELIYQLQVGYFFARITRCVISPDSSADPSKLKIQLNIGFFSKSAN